MRWVLAPLIWAWLFIVVSWPTYATQSCGEPGAPACIRDIVPIIENIIGILAPAAAVALLIMLIWGGFQFITSGGDPKAAAAARSTLTYAIIGVILVLVSWLILLLVENITGVTITIVDFPFN